MAVRFDADGEDFTRTLTLGSQGAVSLSTWVKISTDRNAFSTFVGVDNGSTDTLTFQTNSDGTSVGVWEEPGVSGFAGSTRNLTVGTWYWIAFSVNGTTGTMYSRAAGEATTTTAALSGLNSTHNLATLRIAESVFGTEWLNGCVCNTKLWTAALSQEELELEQAFQPRRTANLQAWYPMIRWDPTDFSGNNRTLSGGTGAGTEDGPGIPWGYSTPRVVLPAVTAQQVAVGQAEETDTAHGLTKLVAAGQSSETDTAQSIVPTRSAAVGQATETDTAQSVTHSKAVTVGQATETDTAWLVTSLIGLASTVDMALDVTPLKTPDVGFEVHVDWHGDGDFVTAGDDVTSRTLERAGLTAEYGRDQERALSPMASGRASLELDNRSRDYSPDNLTSPLYGQVFPGRPLRIQATQDGVTYILFRGHIDDFEVKPGIGERSVSISGLDPIAKLKGTKISTALHKGIRTGAAIGHILDAIDWPSGDRDIDLGATTIRWFWEHDSDAFEAISKLVASEGPGAFVAADPTGKIIFRDRHHRLLDSPSTTAQATFTDVDEPAFSDLSYDHGWSEIINFVTLGVEERDPSEELETVWESADLRSIGASETLTIRVETEEPAIDQAVSYTTTAGSVTPSLTAVSARAFDLALTAGGSAAAVKDIVVEGRPVAVRRSYRIEQEDTGSITKYGRRDYTHEAPWVHVYDAAAIAELIIGSRAERLPIVSITLISECVRPSDRLTQQLQRDLSDRVHVREPETGLDHDYYIDQIKHSVESAGILLVTEFGMEKAPVHPSGVFRFNDAAHGFNDGLFGAVGLDDPSNLFIFDTSGHGFNDGVFAT